LDDLLKEAFVDELEKLSAQDEFARGFLDEMEKMGFDKEAIAPLAVAAAIPLWGALTTGLGYLTKPKGMKMREWMPKGTTGKIFGHGALLGTALLAGGGTISGLGAAGRVGATATRAGTTAAGVGRAARVGQWFARHPKTTAFTGSLIPEAGFMGYEALTRPSSGMMGYRPPRISGF
jgi:hypothetical protein